MRQFSGLLELEPARPASKGRPAASPVWTNPLSKDGPPVLPGVETLYESFRSACEQWPNKRCLGHRPIVKGVAQPYQFVSFAEVERSTAQLASGFKALGLKRYSKVGVLGVNSPEWMLAMQACNRMNYVCVPLYETLGENAIEFILEHSAVSLVAIQGNKLGRLAKALSQVQRLAGVVYWGEASDKDIKAVQETGNTVYSYAQVQQLGGGSPAVPDPPKPGDLSTIMYTSGTTGDPKGVMITHACLVSAIAGCNAYLESYNESLNDDDAYLSFLPLAHVFDRLAEEFMLAKGGCVGYWQGEIPKVLEDIQALRPTLFCGVPRVFDRVYAGINEQASKNPIRWFIFNMAMRYKAYWMKQGLRHDKACPLVDRIVFNKVKTRLGGRVRLILSGAAPLAVHVQEMLSCTMCAPVLQGYGLTETCAASTIAQPYVWDTIGTVGGPMPGVEIRLEAVPEMGYSPSADPPAGEVCIRGPAVFSGYYKQEALTRESIDEDGFFHTGDIAQLVGRGTLQIVDRKKNIFKLAQGEYVAVEKLESALKGCRYLEQVWVYGNSFESCLVAVVVPEPKALAAWGVSKGLRGQSYEELAAHPDLPAHLLEELTATGRAAGLKGFELVKALHVATTQFSVDNDLMTPTFKLRRPQLLAHYKDVVDGLYASLKGSSAASSRWGSKAPSAASSRGPSRSISLTPQQGRSSKGGAGAGAHVVASAVSAQ